MTARVYLRAGRLRSAWWRARPSAEAAACGRRAAGWLRPRTRGGWRALRAVPAALTLRLHGVARRAVLARWPGSSLVRRHESYVRVHESTSESQRPLCAIVRHVCLVDRV